MCVCAHLTWQPTPDSTLMFDITSIVLYVPHHRLTDMLIFVSPGLMAMPLRIKLINFGAHLVPHTYTHTHTHINHTHQQRRNCDRLWAI